jgi:hypothetical protein
MKKINVRDLRPQYNWIWTGTSFRWKFEENSDSFAFEKEGKSYVEYVIPEWQRGHVWTEEQQIAYIEYCFTNPVEGSSAANIVLAEMQTGESDIDFHVKIFLVDGLQRTTAVRRFLKGEFKVFGRTAEEYNMAFLDFRVHMLKVKSEKEAMELYLALNGTGTPHTMEELNRVRTMLEIDDGN